MVEFSVKYKKEIFGFVAAIAIAAGYSKCPKNFEDAKDGIDIDFDLSREKQDAGN